MLPTPKWSHLEVTDSAGRRSHHLEKQKNAAPKNRDIMEAADRRTR